MGSIEADMVLQSPFDKRRSVIAAMMQTDDSGLTLARAASKELSPLKSMIWADFIVSLDAMFSAVIFLRTLASPITVNSRLTDILSGFSSRFDPVLIQSFVKRKRRIRS